MPIEREFKFVMDLNLDTNNLIDPIVINQYYLPNGGRVRFESRNNVEKITFNYKEFISSDIGQVEIENVISKNDAELLKSVAISKLSKIRYHYIDEKNNKWEIDFLKDNNETYFILMELEVDQNEIYDISLLPASIKDKILLEVDSSDNSFTSKKLEDKKYAQNKYSQIKKGS